MSELGNINKSLGKQINISIANTYSENILNSTVLPPNTIIISSPIDNDGNDIGTYCLIATDNNGVGVRLSYTIQPGNGLNIQNDILEFDIDNDTIGLTNTKELQVNINNIIDNNTISINNDKLEVNVQNLSIATDDKNGVVLIDNSTTKINDIGNLYVDGENLDKANETSFGIITSDNDTIYIDSNGIVSVNTNNLSKATSDNYGIVKIDGSTLNSSYGNISVNTSNLIHCTNTYFGIVKPDNNTVVVKNGELYINTQNIRKASNSEYGITKPDNVSLISNNGVLSMNNYDKIIANIDNVEIELNELETTISKLNEKIFQVG